jgi:CheY-like chemotaxis protein
VPTAPPRPDPNRFVDDRVMPPTAQSTPVPENTAFVDPVRGPVSTPLFTAPQVDAEAARTSLLFVDDDTAVVQMLASFFSKKGYQVVTAADGVEAMGKLVGQAFDGVIADLNMPRLDGWGLLRLIREDLRTHEVPVALFSAQDNYRESLRLLHAGAQAYFPKTLRLTSLELQVKELLEPRRRFVRLIASDGGVSFDLSALGLQWVCRVLEREAFTGQLDAADGWGTWRVWFADGRLVQASARMGTNLLSGDRALASLLAAKKAEGSLLRGTRSGEDGFNGHSTRATLDRLVPWLASEQGRAREDQLARAHALTVNEDLYRLYVTVGPPAWLPIVRLLCESKLPPAEVIARLQVTPMEVATVVKDLLRRGVASLQ